MKSAAQIVDVFLNFRVDRRRPPLVRTLVLSLLAGGFLALATAGSFVIGAGFPDPALRRILSALVFPIGLVLIVLTGADLFTGRTLLLLPLLARKNSLSATLRYLLLVLLGNFLGSLAVVFLLLGSGTFAFLDGQVGLYVLTAAVGKVTQAPGTSFLLGLGCHLLVCVAVWVAYGVEDATGKILAVYLPIFLFILLGFEQSIANLFTLPAALILRQDPLQAAAAQAQGIALGRLTLLSSLSSLALVTLGNVAGGALLSLFFWRAYVKE